MHPETWVQKPSRGVYHVTVLPSTSLQVRAAEEHVQHLCPSPSRCLSLLCTPPFPYWVVSALNRILSHAHLGKHVQHLELRCQRHFAALPTHASV